MPTDNVDRNPGSKSRHPIPQARSGSSEQRRIPPPVDDVLASPPPSTDDTPTIISRNSPASPITTEPDTGIRGRRLAHFELIEPIGVGGMAAVLRARDTQLDRFVALKILPPEMAADAENVRRFHQEARSAARLDHQNIARVFFCGEDQRLHFIAFEFVEGDNLRAVLEQRGTLSVADAVHYMIQVAAGLAHAHSRGVVHRDIKPSNIIITPSGRAKLVDMGLARTLERQGEHELTQSGVTLGTFDYISPEQALEPRDADVRSDIYSLGCTFYHVLTGRTPTPEGTAARKLHCHQHVKPVDPRQYVPDLPIEVVAILDKMMAKKPADRFQTPDELVHQLLQTAKKLGLDSSVPEGVLTVETATAAPAGRPLLWAALAAIAVIALVFALDPLSGPSPMPDNSLPKRNSNDSGVVVKDSNPPDKGIEKQPVAHKQDHTPEENIYESPERPTARHLLDWLAARTDAARIELRLKGDLVLTPAEGAAQCLLIGAKQQVIIEPLEKNSRPTIRLKYDHDPAKKPLVALTVSAPQVRITGVRFVVDARGADAEMAALNLVPG
jgi:serine/threonine protein kinase